MKKTFHLGLDIGGTKVEAVILDKDFNVLARERTKTMRDEGYAAVLERISVLIEKTCAIVSISSSDLSSVGAGLPGTVDPVSNRMLNGNTNIFIGQDFHLDLQERLKLQKTPVIENDANCFALAEAVMGAGKKFSKETNRPLSEIITVGVILGTGVGGGLVLNQKIYHGSKGAGMEIGHTQLIYGGHKCYCGRSGCAESYLSGTGIESNYLNKKNITKKAKDIFSDAEDAEFVQEYTQLLGQFIANISNIIDPDLVVLGGGVSNQDALYSPLNQMIKQQFFLKDRRPFIAQNVLGDSAGVFGATLLGVQ